MVKNGDGGGRGRRRRTKLKSFSLHNNFEKATRPRQPLPPAVLSAASAASTTSKKYNTFGIR